MLRWCEACGVSLPKGGSRRRMRGDSGALTVLGNVPVLGMTAVVAAPRRRERPPPERSAVELGESRKTSSDSERRPRKQR